MDTIDLKTIPIKPGVYLFKDDSSRIVYVGKAKHLRKRVASYFHQRGDLSPKTRAMLAKAVSIDTLVTDTEKEALLLEASLIKKHRPRYNVVLRDDKQYVLFRLDKQSDYPRLTITRRVIRDGSVYFGPFTSALAARDTWKAVHRVFPLRRCKDSAFKNRVRPCLYHQIGLCLAPCVLDVDKDEYRTMVKRVEMLLSGRSGELLQALEAEMKTKAEALEYEEAAILRDQIAAVKRTTERQATVLNTRENADVIGLADTDKGLALGILFIRQGRLLDKDHFFWPGLSLTEGPEALAGFLAQYYAHSGPGRYIPEHIITPWDVADMDEEEDGGAGYKEALAQAIAEKRGGRVILHPPRTDTEKRLVSMAGANAREEAARSTEISILPALAAKLKLPAEPQRIEAVDVSHHGGQETKAGVVVFEDAQPRKDQYRVYAFPEMEGSESAGDDYTVLYAWTLRRLKSGPPWPDLLLIDGGKGQLSAVEAALASQGQETLWPLASIAKTSETDQQGGRTIRRSAAALEDRIFRPGRKNHLPLKPGSPELLFLQHVRDTVHNYVIGRHRKARRKKVMASELLRLPGVGPKTARLLWDAYGSLAEMAEASQADLEAIPGLGKKKAAALHAELQKLKS